MGDRAREPASDRFGIAVSLAALAAPMLLGQAGQVIVQLTDTYLIGHLGAVPLAGAALAGNFVTFAMYLAFGAVGAVAPMVARAHGAGDRLTTTRTARAGMVLALLAGAAVAAALSIVAPLLSRLGQPADVAAAARGYLLLIAWSLPGAILAVVAGQVAESMDRPWPVFGFMAAAVVLNGFLAWCLVFGHAGCPALGLVGAGVATFVARWIHAVALVAWVFADPRLGSPRPGEVSAGVGACLRRLLAEGFPVAAQDALEGGAFAAGAVMLGWVGTEALAANQVTVGIASLAWMVPVSLSMATAVRVAQAAGAGDLHRARRTGIVALGFGTAVMACCSVVYLAGGRWLAGLFTDDRTVAEMAGTLVAIAGIYQVSDVIQSVSLGALRGMLDNRVPMVANFVCYWLLSLPTVWWLTFRLGWGAAGVWAGYLPWMIATGLFFLVRFLRLTSARHPVSGKTVAGPVGPGGS